MRFLRRSPPSADELSAFVDGELGRRRRRRMLRHLEDCEPCRRFVEQLSGVSSGLQRSSDVPVSPRLRAELLDAYEGWAAGQRSTSP